MCFYFTRVYIYFSNERQEAVTITGGKIRLAWNDWQVEKKCLCRRFHLSLVSRPTGSGRINAVCRATLAFYHGAASRTQSLSAICHYACRGWWHWYSRTMYWILAPRAKWIEGYHNYGSKINETLCAEINIPFSMNLRPVFTVDSYQDYLWLLRATSDSLLLFILIFLRYYVYIREGIFCFSIILYVYMI